MKKILSILTTLALVVLMVPSANAAGINGMTAVISSSTVSAPTTVTLTLPSAVALADATGTVTVTVRTMAGTALDLSTHQITAATNGGDAMTLTQAGNASGVVLVTDIVANGSVATPIVLTFPASTFTANTSYMVTAQTSAGDFGSSIMQIGTSQQIAITATVEPTLAMTIGGGAVSFGTLVPNAISTAGTPTTLTVSTNASAGYTLQAASASNGLSDGAGHFIQATAAQDLSALNAEGFGVRVSTVQGSLNKGGTVTVPAAFGSNLTTVNHVAPLTTVATTIATDNKATSQDVVTVAYKAVANAITAAGNYTNTVTYTATGTF